LCNWAGTPLDWAERLLAIISRGHWHLKRTGRMVARRARQPGRVGVGAWSGTSDGGAWGTTGAGTAHRAAKGARQVKSCSGAADARERRVGKHYRCHSRCQSCHRVSQCSPM